jgi:hypothetical protein
LRCSLFRFVKNSEKQQKNSERFAVIFAAKRPEAQDFCGGRELARCKFSGRTAKTVNCTPWVRQKK